jgi:hypothetical protein
MVRPINRFSKKVSKIERLAERKKIIEYRQKGEGLYVFRNRSREATLDLPKPSSDGKTAVGPANPQIPGAGEWEGDSYFMDMVRRNEAVLVRIIRSPEEERMMNSQEKLILDQPDQITSEGTVEHIVFDPKKSLNETPEDLSKPKPDVLLTEDPMEGIQIIRD